MKFVKTFKYGQQEVTLETGEIARQATAAVLVRMGNTAVLVTAVCSAKPKADAGFFPLTVNYQERTYAAGRIPGGFFKREGRPSEKETLTSRLIDRPIRPLFPEGFKHDVQIVATVMSVDSEYDPDIAALIGTSAALALSGIPFNGPVGAARVGYIDDQFVINPTHSELKKSSLDLVVAGTEKAVLMVESEVKELPEGVMLDAVMHGHHEMQVVIKAVRELAKEVGVTPMVWEPAAEDTTLIQSVEMRAKQSILDAFKVREKLARKIALDKVHQKVIAELVAAQPELTDQVAKIDNLLSDLESSLMRDRVIQGELRIDGRDPVSIRPINVQVGLLKRTHGSAMFTRGETQAIVVTTLGTERDSQLIDGLEGECKDSFMLHYNFPPYCVGEVGMVGSPKRREIGHGRLARRGVQAVLPNMEEYPYAIRVVSEITESNGSSSMASVCGTSLSLMDAGVPVKAPVAGIAMGLIKEGDRFVVLSDIIGDEDHLGDMDFKVAGTAQGITALQMDIKIEGVTREIMEVALGQAKTGRLHILGEMNKVLSQSRQEMSDFAPRIVTFNINPEKIRDVIGKGGSTIRSIIEETGVEIDIGQDGVVKVAGVDLSAIQEARKRIDALTAEAEVGAIYEGKVSKIADFGAFITILPGKDGLLHISQISNERVNDVNDYLSVGQSVRVKVLEVDRQGRVRLSMKELIDA